VDICRLDHLRLTWEEQVVHPGFGDVDDGALFFLMGDVEGDRDISFSRLVGRHV